MVNVIFDERKWKIMPTLANEDCPYLYYPANIHACKLNEGRIAKQRKIILRLPALIESGNWEREEK